MPRPPSQHQPLWQCIHSAAEEVQLDAGGKRHRIVQEVVICKARPSLVPSIPAATAHLRLRVSQQQLTSA